MKFKKFLSCASDGIEVLRSYHFAAVETFNVNRIFQTSKKAHKPQIYEEKRKSCTKSHY